MEDIRPSLEQARMVVFHMRGADSSLHHLPKRYVESALREAARALRPRGIFFVAARSAATSKASSKTGRVEIHARS